MAAALDRQHPRDLFDIRLMFDFVTDFAQIKKGFFYALLGSDRPVIELLSPNRINHRETLVNQFAGMTEVPFSYNDYEEIRERLIDFIHSNLTQQDREFLIAFESGDDLLPFTEYQEFLLFPAVQWKLQNIQKLKEGNQNKLRDGVKKLEQILS